MCLAAQSLFVICSLRVVCEFKARECVSPICPHCVQLAPENTMMSFNRSIACGVTAFETDVQLRYNGFILFFSSTAKHIY